MNGGTEMDVREKLVELLTDNLLRIGNLPKCDNPLQYTTDEIVERIADHLIANGVTVQEWVSIDERLPGNFSSVLGYMTDAGEFPPVRECYTVGNVFFFPALGDIHPVSHWCEMPQPPKGE